MIKKNNNDQDNVILHTKIIRLIKLLKIICQYVKSLFFSFILLLLSIIYKRIYFILSQDIIQ